MTKTNMKETCARCDSLMPHGHCDNPSCELYFHGIKQQIDAIKATMDGVSL